MMHGGVNFTGRDSRAANCNRSPSHALGAGDHFQDQAAIAFVGQ